MATGLPSIIATQSVTIVRPTMVTDHNVSVPDYTLAPAETVTVTGCSVQPGAGGEDRNQRDAIQGDFDVWVPLGVTVGPFDRVLVEGYSGYLRITGQPEYWAVGRLEHEVLHLSAWKG